jgi:hypothetical protein
MAQYQVRTGPVTNDAATFEPAMVQGSKPDQPRLFSSRNQQGLTLAQTTHVPAPFVPSMSAGYGPEKNRERLPLRIGWSVSQTTHDAAPFSLEMSAGWVPDRNRERLPLRTGWSISQPTQTDAPFSIEMVKGWQPESARVFRVKLGWSWSEHTFDLVMSPDMFGGWHPDTSRAFLAPRLGQPLSQTAQHVAAPFTPEMVAGSGPDRARLFVKPRLGWQWAETTFDVQMTAEMFAGSHPDTSRAWLAPRIPLPLAQPSHVSAPFGHEMVAGQHPDLPRQPFKAKDGWQTAQLAFVVQMTPDQWAGWLPSAPRIFLGPKIPLPISQPTQVNAPFTPDMVAGNHPDAPRKPFVAQSGWTINQLTFVVQMTPEMFAGSHPDTHRQKLAPRIPLPLAQTTHTSAPFTPDMVQGSQPARHRQAYGKQIIGWIQGLIQGLFGTPSQPTEFFTVASQDRTFSVPTQGRFRTVTRRDTFAIDAQGRFVQVDDQDREFDA